MHEALSNDEATVTDETTVTDEATRVRGAGAGESARGTSTLPPRWFVRGAWLGHRALLRVTRDRVGLATPTPGGRFGMLRLRTIGRRSGRERAVVIGYVEDEGRLVTLAMNGWAQDEPAWWLNLQAAPEARVDLRRGGTRPVRAHEATGAERERLWATIRSYDGYGDVDALAATRGRPTAVVVLEFTDRAGAPQSLMTGQVKRATS